MQKYKKNRLRLSTYEQYYSYWKRYLKEEIGYLDIKVIKRIDIIQLYNGLLHGNNKLSIGTITIRYINNILHGMLKQAVLNNLIYRNPVENIMQEVGGFKVNRRRALYQTEEKYFLQ